MRKGRTKIDFTIIRKEQPVSFETLSALEQDKLNNIALDAFSLLDGLQCVHHPQSRIDILMFDNDQAVKANLFTCCFDFAEQIRKVFEPFPHPVRVAYLAAYGPNNQKKNE